MKWTIERIEKELEKLSKLKNDHFDIPVEINPRLTRALGRTFSAVRPDGYRTPTKIDFSKKLLEGATDDCIMGVIKHEWAHYYITKTTHESHGHDYLFHMLCNEIGTSGNVATKVEYIRAEDAKPKKYKYELYCTECGKLVANYMTSAAKAVKNMDQFSSGCCHAKLRLVQNW